jgi:hypothetical protein
MVRAAEHGQPPRKFDHYAADASRDLPGTKNESLRNDGISRATGFLPQVSLRAQVRARVCSSFLVRNREIPATVMETAAYLDFA